jgi:hypothetical protein
MKQILLVSLLIIFRDKFSDILYQLYFTKILVKNL